MGGEGKEDVWEDEGDTCCSVVVEMNQGGCLVTIRVRGRIIITRRVMRTNDVTRSKI